LTTHITRS